MKIITVGLMVALICVAGLTVSRSASTGEPVTGETKERSTVSDMITSGATRAHEIERISQYYGVTINELEIKYQQTYFLFPRSCPGPFAKITVRGTAATMPALVGFRDMVKAIEGAKVSTSMIKKLDDGEFGGLLVAAFAVK